MAPLAGSDLTAADLAAAGLTVADLAAAGLTVAGLTLAGPVGDGPAGADLVRGDLAGVDVLGAFAEFGSDDEEPEWQDRALCAQTDPEAFFPEKGGSTREAKRICQGCDVRAECLSYALAHDERFGIWGGLSERVRRRLRRMA